MVHHESKLVVATKRMFPGLVKQRLAGVMVLSPYINSVVPYYVSLAPLIVIVVPL